MSNDECAFLHSLTSLPGRQTPTMCVPGVEDKSRKGAEARRKDRSRRPCRVGRQRAIEINGQEKRGQKNERGSTTNDTKHTKGKDANKRLRHGCTRIHTDNRRRRISTIDPPTRPSFFCPHFFLSTRFVCPFSCDSCLSWFLFFLIRLRPMAGPGISWLLVVHL
jgi:hypothetical protein